MGKGRGRGIHSIRAKVRARAGINRNKVCEDTMGLMGSLINNLIPSAKG